jgi:hypothetical protein
MGPENFGVQGELLMRRHSEMVVGRIILSMLNCTMVVSVLRILDLVVNMATKS